MNNTRKRVTAGLLAFAIVAGTIPANVQWAEVFGGSTIVAQATNHTVSDLRSLSTSAKEWYLDGSNTNALNEVTGGATLLNSLHSAIQIADDYLNYTNDDTYSLDQNEEEIYTTLETAFNAAKAALNGSTQTAPTVTTAPSALNPTYSGSAQTLVSAGTASSGTIYYALGTDTAATGAYTTTIPSETNADTYYVWYKAIDGNSESEAACVPVTVFPKSIYGATVTLSAASYDYDTYEHKPTVSSVAIDSLTLTTSDFDVSYPDDCTSAAENLTVTVTGKGNFKDAATVVFSIVPGTLSGISATGFAGAYDGQPHSISVTGVPEGATVNYSTDGEHYSTANCIYQDVTDGAQTVYYKVEKTNYTTVTGSATINITKAAPNVTAPTASAITYGQTLNDSTLTGGSVTGIGGSSINGTFAWKTPTTVPTVSNSGYTVVFTPNDTTNYNTVELTVSPTVNKATPVISTAPTASAITYGQTLNDSTLTGGSVTGVTGATLEGAFTWTTSSTAPDVADSNTTEYNVTFTPNDATNYNTASCNVKLTVNKAAPSVTAPTAIQSLGYTGSPKELVTAGTATGGTMYYAVTDNTATSAPTNDSAWSTTVPSKTDAGNYKVWYIVRGDENHTDTVPAYVEASIAPAENPIAFTAAQTVTKPFSESAQTATLTAAADAEGTVTYSIDSQKNSAQTAVSYFSLNGTTLGIAANTPIGTYTVAVKASAAGNTNYNSKTATSTVTVTVDKADNSFATAPVLASAPMYTGTPLSLIATPGTPKFGNADKVSYAVTTTDTAPAADAESWTTYDNIKADAAGTYYIWYKISGEDNWNAVAPTKLGAVTVTNKSDQSWTISMSDYVYDGIAHEPTINGTAYGKLTYTYFTSAGVCLGNTAPTEPGDYRVSVSSSGDETHFSMLESADYTIKGAKFSTGNTVSFKKIVEFNFLVEATDVDTVEGAYVVFTYDHYGTTTTVKKPINKDDKNGKYYRVRLPLTASEMAIDIKAELYLATSDKPVDTRTRSIKDYAEAAIKADLDGADVLKAMLNYGGYTQTALGNNTELLANSGEGIAVDVSSISPKSATAFERPEPYEGAQRTSIGGIPENVNIKFTPKVTYKGSTVITKSDVYVRHYFEVDPSLSSAELEKVMVQVGYNIPVPITRLRKNSTGYYYDTAPQLAYELDKENKSILVFGFAGTVTNIEAYTEVDGNSVASGAKIIEITPAENSSYSLYSIYIENYSVIDYCEAVANSNKQTAASKNMAKALYSYYMAAKAYVEMRA
ncbi:hypothetical protein [Ruminococcus sp. NK3A76]|uniref:hypothetical protein n=1 Tax=Ruminococcus sp. NK3A76 TaxID=877411 RepID=UPI00048AD1F0|nr:hypothetical protein [Ruminococcus sp. NK3A76]